MAAIGQTSAQLSLRDPDVRLMIAVRDDMPGAFEELVGAYQHRLINVMQHLVGRTDEAVAAFVRRLKDDGLSVKVRKRKGSEIDAACGQLRRTELAKG